MAVRIQLRRGTSSEWTTTNPVLGSGEFGYETNTGKFKIGNGSTAWTSLSYSTPDLTGTSPITFANGVIGINQALLEVAQSQVTNLSTTLSGKQAVVSGVDDTEIGYLNGVTSAIQTQIDTKAATSYVDTGLSGKLDTGGNAVSATTATNIAGGTAGRVPYQSGANTTVFTAVGTAGQVLTSNGTSAPTWRATAESGFNAFLLSGM